VVISLLYPSNQTKDAPRSFYFQGLPHLHKKYISLAASKLSDAAFLAYYAPMKTKPSDDQYSAKEARARFEKALQGAFKTPPTPMKSMTPKRPKPQQKHSQKNDRK
jgi:hypothetical protein